MSQPCCSLASLAGPGGEREAEKLVIRKEVLVVLTASMPPPTPFLCAPLYPATWARFQGTKQTTSFLVGGEDSGLRQRHPNKPSPLYQRRAKPSWT